MRQTALAATALPTIDDFVDALDFTRSARVATEAPALCAALGTTFRDWFSNYLDAALEDDDQRLQAKVCTRVEPRSDGRAPTSYHSPWRAANDDCHVQGPVAARSSTIELSATHAQAHQRLESLLARCFI